MQGFEGDNQHLKLDLSSTRYSYTNYGLVQSVKPASLALPRCESPLLKANISCVVTELSRKQTRMG